MALSDTFTGTAVPDASGHVSDSGHTLSQLTGDGLLGLTGSGAIYPDITGFTGWAYYDYVPGSDDYYVEATVDVVTVADQAVSLFVRLINGPDAHGVSAYVAQWYAGTWHIYKVVPDLSFASLGNVADAALADGEVIRLEVIGGATTTLTLYIDGIEILEVADSTSPLTAAGKCGPRMYTAVNSSSGAVGYNITLFEADVLSAVPSTPTAFHGTILSSGDAEISWDSVPSATSYNLYRSPTSGGSFSLLATITDPSDHYYVDADYSAGNFYKLSAASGGGESTLTAEFEPTAYIDWHLSQVSGRHDLLSNGRLAIPANLIYDETHLDSAPVKGPPPETSFSLFDENNPTLPYVAGTRPPAPNFSLVAEFSALGDQLVGYADDATHGIWVRFDESSETIDIYGQNGGAETSIMAAVSVAGVTAPFKIGVEFINNVVAVWLIDPIFNATWGYVGSGFAADGGAYDLRIAANMTSWQPSVIGSSVTRFRCNGFGGSGRLREMHPVTWTDLTPYRSGDVYLMGYDRTGPVPTGMGNGTLSVGYGLSQYDPTAPGDFTLLANISFEADDGRLLSTQECDIIYEAGIGWHIWMNDWSGWVSTGFPSATKVYYQLYTGTLAGFVHLDSAVPITLHASVDAAHYNGVQNFKANNKWFQVGSVIDAGLTRMTLTKGDTPSNFDTFIYQESVDDNGVEGVAFFPLGTRLYVIGGSHDEDVGSIRYWDFSDLTTPVYTGKISYDIPHTDLAQQPSILWYPNPLDETQMIPQLLTFKNTAFTNLYDSGLFQVSEPAAFLDYLQFPSRLAGGVTNRLRGRLHGGLLLGGRL